MAYKNRAKITPKLGAIIKATFSYDPITGKLTHTATRQDAYRAVPNRPPCVYFWHDRRAHTLSAMRVAYYLMLGTDTSRHLCAANRNRHDLRWENIVIREARPGFDRISKDAYKTKGRTSQYKGVYKHGKRWMAQIQYDHHRVYLGTFDTEEEAAIAYNSEAERVWQEKAKLNAVPKRTGKRR